MAAYRRFAANRVVAEINNGGEMVAEVLRQNDPNLPVRNVTATRGKFLRAEPIAAAYERGVVFHLGVFAKLEDQLCTLTPDFDARAAGFSPDRADALVWAVADLISPIEPGSHNVGLLREAGEGRMKSSPRVEAWRRDGMQDVAELAMELGGGELRVDGIDLVVLWRWALHHGAADAAVRSSILKSASSSSRSRAAGKRR